jgi:uncharacterized RDD family membrane protein YckC
MRYISVGRRFLAWGVDLLIIGCGIAALGDYGDGPGYQVSWLGWRYVLAFLVLPASYLVLFEWLASATPGKFLVGIRVRSEQGERIGLGQSIVRNLARLIDALPYVIPYLVGSVVISGSPTRQRLGDRWAGTVVIAWGSERVTDPALPQPPDRTAETPDGIPPAPVAVPIPPPPPAGPDHG